MLIIFRLNHSKYNIIIKIMLAGTKIPLNKIKGTHFAPEGKEIKLTPEQKTTFFNNKTINI